MQKLSLFLVGEDKVECSYTGNCKQSEGIHLRKDTKAKENERTKDTWKATETGRHVECNGERETRKQRGRVAKGAKATEGDTNVT